MSDSETTGKSPVNPIVGPDARQSDKGARPLSSGIGPAYVRMQLWCNALVAALRQGRGCIYGAKDADEAIAEFDKRFSVGVEDDDDSSGRPNAPAVHTRDNQ